MARAGDYLVALDAGTSKVGVAVARPAGSDALDVVGLGLAQAHGIRHGVVNDVGAAIGAIRRAVEEAELTAGIRVDAAHVGFSGPHIGSVNSRGVVSVRGNDGVITHDDVCRAIDAATSMPLPADREILHVLPQHFAVDGQDGLASPIGRTGVQLEANVHIITVPGRATQSVLSCVERAGVSVLDTVLDPLAASETVLTSDEKALGVALVDIGAGATHVAIFEHGTLAHTGVVPVGGDQFTNAVAVGLRTPLADAERIKRRWGWAFPTVVDDDEVLEIASLGDRPPRRMCQRLLSEVLEPQARKLFELLQQRIREAGYRHALDAGVVITGGGSLLGGMVQAGRRILDLPIRRGAPTAVGGLTWHVNSPALSTLVGLLVYAHRHPFLATVCVGGRSMGRVANRLRGLWV